MTFQLSVHRSKWPLKSPFRITGYVFNDLETVEVQISDGTHIGRGEATGVYYLEETAEMILEQVEDLRPAIEKGLSVHDLQSLIGPGGARNAIDCALWDLECKRNDKSIWDLTGIKPKPTKTVYTIGIEDTPDAMAAHALRASSFSCLKIKLDSFEPVARIAAIRKARPDATLIIDANQGFSKDQLDSVVSDLADLGVSMIEQPLARGADEALKANHYQIPICGDESCLDSSELHDALARYDMINIKLDKAGGLTEALIIARVAKRAGKRLMVGNMLGTSLGMAPGFVIAQLCDLVDLDGPLSLKSDHLGGLIYRGDEISISPIPFWGRLHKNRNV